MSMEPNDSAPLRVLVVADNEDDFLITRELLHQGVLSGRKLAPIVRWAPDYRQGLRAIQEDSFDVLLVDYSAHPHGGLDYMDECNRIGKQVPFLLLTREADYDLEVDAMGRGAADCLAKNTLTAVSLERSIRYACLREKNLAPLRLVAEENRRILESAHCLLITTEVVDPGDWLRFSAVVSNVEMAQRILPLDVPAGQTYAEAMYFARHPEDRAAANATAIEAIRSGRSGFQAEYRVTNSRGELVWLLEDTSIERIDPTHWRLTVVCADITERKRLDEAARVVETQMTELVNAALDGIILINEHGVILEFNPAAESIFGFLRENAVGLPLVELIIPTDQRDSHICGMAAYLETGIGPVVGQRTELMALHADGSEFPVELAVSAIRLGDAMLFFGFVRDISDRVRSESEIRTQAQRIEADRARLAQAQALAGTGSWSFDVPTQCLALSDEFFRIAGYEPHAFEVTWTNFLECVQWEDRPLVISSEMFDDPKQLQPPDQLVRVRRPDGEVRIMVSRTRAVYDSSGERIRVDGTMADVTDRKNAEEDLDRFFSMSLDMLSIGSVDGYLKRINPAFELTLGHPISDLLAEPFISFVHPDDRADSIERMRFLESGITVTGFTNRFRCRDGSYRWLLWNVTPYGDRLYSVARDVTPLRDAEDRLLRANLDLEARVAERTASLEDLNVELMEAKRQADRANLAKSEFLSRMSHELRTPLNAILGFGQILVRQKLGTQNEESVNYILMGGRHLLQLINEVLDIARVESGHIDLSIEVVEVGLIVRECLDLARTIAEEHQVRLNPQDGDQCRSFALADQRRLKQVILNLVSNGIKYNVLGGSVGIRCAESVDGRVLIEVVDTGIGFRPEDLPKLFTPFERLDANNSAVEGTGLGLALSHRLVQQMGGTIEVESVRGVGSKFTVNLPSAPKAVSVISPSSLEIPELESVLHPGRISTVLCIEDNPLNLRLLESIFARRPEITLLTAGRGLEGIEAAIRHHPDLVLLDLDLPDISGLRVLQALRLTNGLETVPVIVVSADATRGQIAKLMAAGAADYVTKPLDVAVLLRAVDAALDARASA